MDNLTKKQRRKNMQNIRSKGTKPERILASALRARKIYFGRNLKSIIGKPDFVIRKRRIVIFVDSDFWHCHPKRFIMPKTNKSYWLAKIARNKRRDQDVNKRLRKDGWKIVRLWDYDIKNDIHKCMNKIVRAV